MKLTQSRNIWIFTSIIVAMGLMALYSATFQNVRVSQDIFFSQLQCAVIGLILMYVLSRVDYRRFYDAAYILYFINILMLLSVLLTGRNILGARRWIAFAGLRFQPSELTKLAIILVMARYFSHRRPKLSFDFLSRTQMLIHDLFIPFGLTLIGTLLIFKQPDLGTALLVLGIFVVMLFASGIEYKYILGSLCLGLLILPLGWHLLKPYQKDRLLVFLNPNIDPLGAGYTIIQSKIAVGSGRIFGNGWLAGTQNQLNFLPERHTDFIFSVLGEEWGLAGTLFLLYCYFVLINSCLNIAMNVKDKFGMLVGVGIVAILTLQVIINIGMVIGLFPVVGLTLPLVSYGRSSFLIFCIMLGFMLNLSKKRTIFY